MRAKITLLRSCGTEVLGSLTNEGLIPIASSLVITMRIGSKMPASRMAEVAPLTRARVARRQVVGHSRVFGRRNRRSASARNVSAGKMPLRDISRKARGKLLTITLLASPRKPTITRKT